MKMGLTERHWFENEDVPENEVMQWWVWLLLMALGTSLDHYIEKGGKPNDNLSVLNGQTSSLTYAFNPETLAFRNKVIALQKSCPMVEWEHDMGATIPFCKLDQEYCNGQCTFKTNDCPCETEGGEK